MKDNKLHSESIPNVNQNNDETIEQGCHSKNDETVQSGMTTCHHNERHSHHSNEEKKKLISRLNRIEGQIRGIKAMIEKDTYCDDVLTQIAAAQSALGSTAKLLLEAHMKSCIVERIEAGEHEVVDELLVTVGKLMK